MIPNAKSVNLWSVGVRSRQSLPMSQDSVAQDTVVTLPEAFDLHSAILLSSAQWFYFCFETLVPFRFVLGSSGVTKLERKE